MIARRFARMRGDLSAAIALGITSAAAAACYGPPVCSDLKREDRKVVLSNLTVAADGSFSSPERGHFASCRTFCAVESGVDTVHDCKGPSQVGKQWEIACAVESTECSRTELIGFGSGRRPEGFCPETGPADTLGDHFAFAARLEAASVLAFHRLACELVAHRAPVSLVRAARRAARDEVKHTRVMRALARHFGVEVALPQLAHLPVRPLAAIAIENAVEGCVGETLGAILATVQAARAADRRVRRAMTLIADDETAHAILAWEVHRWATGRLDVAAKAAVEDALHSAAHALDARTVGVASRPLRERAGLPDRAETRALLVAARRELWAQAA